LRRSACRGWYPVHACRPGTGALHAVNQSRRVQLRPSNSGPSTAPANIPDNKLDAAAAAAKNVSSLKSTFEQKLAQAPVAEKQRIAEEADGAMVKAVTDQGLSIDEFKTIMTLAQNDPVVRTSCFSG